MTRWTLGGLTLLVIGLAMGGLFFALGPYLDRRVTPGVWLQETHLGGLTPEEAAPYVRTALPLDEPLVVLVGPEGERWTFTPRELGVEVQVAATLAQAYRPGHTRSGFQGVMERLQLMREGTRVAPVLVWARRTARARVETLAARLDVIPVDARVKVEGLTVRVEPGRMGRRVNVTQTLAALEPALHTLKPVELVLSVETLEPEITDAEAARAVDVAQSVLVEPLQLLLMHPRENDPGPWTLPPERLAQMLELHIHAGKVAVGLNEAELEAFLQPLATALHREPQNARFDFDPTTGTWTPIEEGTVGRVLDIPASIARINELLQTGQHHVPLVMKVIEPTYPVTVTAQELGIVEQLAVGESYFGGSSTARSHNIRLGASKFDGIIIGPGETFSFNEYLGDVTPEEGYDESYVIVGDRTIPGVGGGICQVATTAFRAAYYAGLEIVERWPHAYRVGYYELGGYGPGFDATIYSPLVDLRFVNDTDHHLLIETEVDSARSRLRFLFYGTSDGRRVEQIGPTWGEPQPPGPPIYEYDPEMPEGTVEKLESAHDGLHAVLERVVYDAEGNVMHEDRFVSNFIPWQARYRFGPGYTPPEGVEVVGLEEASGEE
ncbi:MAG: VanW family protein [Anaerolineae bacterium]